jgi:hypothetical protein
VLELFSSLESVPLFLGRLLCRWGKCACVDLDVHTARDTVKRRTRTWVQLMMSPLHDQRSKASPEESNLVKLMHHGLVSTRSSCSSNYFDGELSTPHTKHTGSLERVCLQQQHLHDHGLWKFRVMCDRQKSWLAKIQGKQLHTGRLHSSCAEQKQATVMCTHMCAY